MRTVHAVAFERVFDSVTSDKQLESKKLSTIRQRVVIQRISKTHKNFTLGGKKLISLSYYAV